MPYSIVIVFVIILLPLFPVLFHASVNALEWVQALTRRR